MKDIIIFPHNGNGREAFDVIHAINKVKKTWNFLGFIDDNPLAQNKGIIGVSEEALKRPQAHVLAVVGSYENYKTRHEINSKFEKHATIIHPSAQVSESAVIGDNVLIMANVVISCNVFIDDGCIILPNSVISHDSYIQKYCCIGSNVSISGGVRIYRNCYIGSKSSLRDGINIGENTLIGIGSNVVNNCPRDSVLFGNPAKTEENQFAKDEELNK